MIPPRSPYGLIQEDLWPDEWKILVSCMMLNCTTRKQLEKVYPTFFSLWPDPKTFLNCDSNKLKEVIRPLGFANRRSSNLLRMTRDYLEKDWNHASELHGIGEYASRAWEIFCAGCVGDETPRDHALVRYYYWRKKNEINRNSHGNIYPNNPFMLSEED